MAKRNLVVIVADTLRLPGPLETDGRPLMPFISALAKDGLVLPRLFASSSWTAPSHVSLLTGSDPWQTHFHMPSAGRRAPEVESLASRWTKEGGVSAGFSANFLVAPQLGTATGYTRFNPGFPSGLAGLAQLTCTLFGYERFLYDGMGGSTGRPHSSLGRAWESSAQWVGNGLYKSINSMRVGDTLIRALHGFLRRRGPANPNPLHLFFNIAEPHEPYLPGQNGGPVDAPRTLGHLPSINYARFNDLLVDRAQPDPFFDAYRHSLTATDDVLRRLIGTLQRNGVLDNAVLAFVSDHGQNLGEHGFYGHGFYLYDELVKIPGFLWEFRDGKPLPLAPPALEWFDHRHLFDVLASAVPDGPPLDVAGTIDGSLLRRGPASSYYEGPGLRAPDGLVRKAKRPDAYRLLRVQRGSETSLFLSNTTGGDVRPIGADSPETASDELGEIARHILTNEIASAGGAAGTATAMDAQVDARLKSWGYD